MTLNGAGKTEFVLNHTVTGTAIIAGGNGNESAIKIVAKPSDYVEAYFEDTAGLVEGVSDVFYSNKIVLREIDSAAKRTATNTAAGNAYDSNAAGSFGAFLSTNGLNNNDARAFGLVTANIEETMGLGRSERSCYKVGI